MHLPLRNSSKAFMIGTALACSFFFAQNQVAASYGQMKPQALENQVLIQAQSKELLNFQTVSMFRDLFRSDFIARGLVVDVLEEGGFDRLVFQPTNYLYGEALAEETVVLHVGTNADLSELQGQEAVCACMQSNDGRYGLTHGLASITPEAFSVQTSVDFYTDLLALNADYGFEIQQALEEDPADGRYDFPVPLVESWTDVLVRYLGHSDTQAAQHAGRELAANPLFEKSLNALDLRMIADSLIETSVPGSYDRGFSYIILKQRKSRALSIQAAIELIKEETAYINIDHLTNYLRSACGLPSLLSETPNAIQALSVEEQEEIPLFEEQDVVDALKALYENREEATRIRRNAIIAAGQFASELSLPSLRKLLGHESDMEIKHRLLEAFRFIPHQDNLTVLQNYLNGGDALRAEPKIHNDCLDSRKILKRTLLAIAVIGSEESDTLIQLAYETARFDWLKDFIRPLRKANPEWRELVEILDNEADIPVILPEKEAKE